RRLPRAVRAEQPEDLALLDLEADPAERLERAIRLVEIADRDRAQGRSTRHIPPAGNGGSAPPVSAAAMRPQSGWWPTTTTGSPLPCSAATARAPVAPGASRSAAERSEEHTSELKLPYDLVCGVRLETKKARRRGLRDALLRQ